MAVSPDSVSAPEIHSTRRCDTLDRFEEVLSESLTVEAQLASPTHRGDEICALLLDARSKCTWALIEAQAPMAWMVARKIEVMMRLMDNAGEWADCRDQLMAASVHRDVYRMGEQI